MGKNKLAFFTVGVLLLGFSESTMAALNITVSRSVIGDCDSALVRATYNKIDQQYVDWRLAEKVDQATYNQIKTDVGVNAVIYGVPVGASYGDFQENINSLKREHQESYTSQTYRNILWTGLDPNSISAYQQCLQTAAILAKKALVLLPDKATTTNVTFKVIYSPSGTTAPNPVPVKWTIGEGNVSQLPTKIAAGTTIISVKRPSRDVTLALNAIAVGDSDSVVLTPMPPPVKPEDRLAIKCEITVTPPPLPTLAKSGVTSWACPLTMAAGDYRVTVSITPGSNIPARVGYNLGLDSISGGSTKTFWLPLTSGTPIDINADAGLAHVFQSIGSTVRLPQGNAVFKLYIGHIFNHCCFSGDGNAGVVNIPPNVAMGLERLGGQNVAARR